MVAAEYQINEPELLAHVAVRKNGLDASTPWWQQAYFRFVWRPFLRFSFHVFRIPAPHKMNADGSFEFLEGIGIATDEEIAEAMCKDEFYRVAWLPVNTGLPRESLQQHKGHRYPRSTMPDRYRRRTFPLTVAPVAGLAELGREIDKLSKAVAE